MRSAGAKGAPKKGDFANAAKTAKYAEGGPVVSVYDPDEINDLANQILEGAYV